MTHADTEIAPQRRAQSFAHPPAIADEIAIRKLLGAYDTLLDRFMPPSILVDEHWMLVDTYGGADRYLRFSSRRPSHSVLDLVCEPIRATVETAIDRIGQGEKLVTLGPIQLFDESGADSLFKVSVSVVPIDEMVIYYSIAIEPYRPCDPPIPSIEFPDGDVVREASEYQKSEVATSAFVGKASPKSSPDLLLHFLESTRASVVFLDRDLKIRQFTSEAARMFQLVSHDIGREIRTFSGVLEVQDLVDRIQAVIHTGDADEINVHQFRHDKYLVVKIAPESQGDDIVGAIITVIDLSHLEATHRDIRLHSSIIRSTDDAVISRDRENRIITWNAAAEALFGYTADEAIGQPASLIVPPDQEVEPCQTMRMFQRGVHLDHFGSTRRTKSGNLIKVSVRLSPIYDDEDRVIGLSTIERDTSLQSEALDNLNARERWLQGLYNQSPDPQAVVDLATGTIVKCNETMFQRIGFTQHGLPGRSLVDLHSPKTQESAIRCLEQLRTLGNVIHHELELQGQGGEPVSVSLHARVVRDERGEDRQCLCVWRDISSIKDKVDQVKQSELRYHKSFQNSVLGIAQLELDGRYVMANSRLCEILGYEAEELKGLKFSDITHPDDLVEQYELRNEMLTGRGDTYKIEKRYFHKTGHEVWVSLFVSLERDSEGQPIAFHSYVEDISGRKELEAELRLAISQRDQFLAMLSHELRNPLGAILNTCAVLNRGRGLPKTMQQPVSIVTRQAKQMAELLDDLLDVSRITTGKIKLEKSPAILSDIVDEAVESQQGLAASRQQRLVVTYADEPLRIFGDRSRLVQVVVNLLNNAIKYSGEGAVINITLEKRGRCGVIRVKDAGVGIEPELIESLFEMFAQKDSTLDRSGGGMGLGLHLVRKLVEFHSGRVTGFSEGVGRGSEFTVELPLSFSRPKIQKQPKLTSHQFNSKRESTKTIVIVEDIDDARNMLVALLQADDYHVHSAADGEAGLELILRVRPDVAIVDIGLPKVDGYEVARRVRSTLPTSQITLIALSGYGQDSDRNRALEAGFDEHLVKPLNHARLELILKRN